MGLRAVPFDHSCSPFPIRPGLYKIFDEILVNAADNFIRDNSQTYVKAPTLRLRDGVGSWKNKNLSVFQDNRNEFNVTLMCR